MELVKKGHKFHDANYTTKQASHPSRLAQVARGRLRCLGPGPRS